MTLKIILKKDSPSGSALTNSEPEVESMKRERGDFWGARENE